MNTPTPTPPGAHGVLLITGASRGIGAATARLAAQHGWDVAINFARDDTAAQSVATDVRAVGRRALVVQADVAQEADILRLFETVDRELGRLRGLVNNAGIVAMKSRLADMDTARLQAMLQTNVLGSWLCAREAVRRMSHQHGGSGGAIVNLSSVAAVLGAPGMYVDYASSKGAIDTFTVGLARELAAEGIRVNGVRPGIISTDIHASSGDADRPQKSAALIPMGRPGSADEVAQAIVWLLSEQAAYVTGATLDVTGGR